MTNVYKVELCIVDHDQLGSEEIIEVLENTKYPNRCISPKVLTVEGKNIGKWYDEHPLNYTNTQEQELRRLFSPWLPITTAPSNEYLLVWHPDYGVQHARYDAPTWWVFYPDHYFGCQPVLNPAPLYWQPLPQPPQLWHTTGSL